MSKTADYINFQNPEGENVLLNVEYLRIICRQIFVLDDLVGASSLTMDFKSACRCLGVWQEVEKDKDLTCPDCEQKMEPSKAEGYWFCPNCTAACNLHHKDFPSRS